MQMSSHVPSAMIRQRNSGVFSRVAATGSHQQTRRAMAAKCRETVSSACTLFESTFNRGNLAKQTVECEPLGRPTQPRPPWDSLRTGWRRFREMTHSKGALRTPYDYAPFGAPL